MSSGLKLPRPSYRPKHARMSCITYYSWVNFSVHQLPHLLNADNDNDTHPTWDNLGTSKYSRINSDYYFFHKTYIRHRKFGKNVLRFQIEDGTWKWENGEEMASHMTLGVSFLYVILSTISHLHCLKVNSDSYYKKRAKQLIFPLGFPK